MTSYDPNGTWFPDRSVFVGNATRIECPYDTTENSEPAKMLAYGSAIAAALFVLIWLVSGLGESAYGVRALGSNHFGAYWLIPPFFVGMGCVIGWRVVDCTLGCSSWAESAPSISFLTANMMFEGYVLLFVMLTMMAYMFFQRVDIMARNRIQGEREGTRVWTASSLLGEWLMRIGFVLTTFTGIMPSLTSNCHLMPPDRYEYCWAEVMVGPHSWGITGGIGLTFFGYQMRAITPILGRGMNMRPGGGRFYAFLTLVLSEISFFLMCAYFIAWGYFLFNAGAATKDVDLCILKDTEDKCTGADLTVLQQQWADMREGGWRCRWDPRTDYYLYPCTKYDCDADGRITNNKYSVIFEYLGFLMWAVACVGMTQAIDVMDDVPSVAKLAAKKKAKKAATETPPLV